MALKMTAEYYLALSLKLREELVTSCHKFQAQIKQTILNEFQFLTLMGDYSINMV